MPPSVAMKITMIEIASAALEFRRENRMVLPPSVWADTGGSTSADGAVWPFALLKLVFTAVRPIQAQRDLKVFQTRATSRRAASVRILVIEDDPAIGRLV